MKILDKIVKIKWYIQITKHQENSTIFFILKIEQNTKYRLIMEEKKINIFSSVFVGYIFNNNNDKYIYIGKFEAPNLLFP